MTVTGKRFRVFSNLFSNQEGASDGIYREADGKGGALRRGALYIDGAVVQKDDVLHNGESQAHTAGFADKTAIDLKKRLRQIFQVLRRNAHTCIVNHENDIPVRVAPHGNADFVTVAGELEGIGQEVDEHLFEDPLVGNDTRQ